MDYNLQRKCQDLECLLSFGQSFSHLIISNFIPDERCPIIDWDTLNILHFIELITLLNFENFPTTYLAIFQEKKLSEI